MRGIKIMDQLNTCFKEMGVQEVYADANWRIQERPKIYLLIPSTTSICTLYNRIVNIDYTIRVFPTQKINSPVLMGTELIWINGDWRNIDG